MDRPQMGEFTISESKVIKLEYRQQNQNSKFMIKRKLRFENNGWNFAKSLANPWHTKPREAVLL